jgi:hypothetical protein
MIFNRIQDDVAKIPIGDEVLADRPRMAYTIVERVLSSPYLL